jgi:hypothetical protein
MNTNGRYTILNSYLSQCNQRDKNPLIVMIIYRYEINMAKLINTT